MSQKHVIRTGVPGVFYRRPSPAEAPYVEENGQVKQGDTIGLVEIMKSFHPVVADVAGTISRFLVDSDEEVAPGQEIAEIVAD